MTSPYNKALVALFLCILIACTDSYSSKMRNYQNLIELGDNENAYQVLSTIPDSKRTKEQFLFEYRFLFPKNMERIQTVLLYLKNFTLTASESKEYLIGSIYVCQSQLDYDCVEKNYLEYYEIKDSDTSIANFYNDFLIDTLQFSHSLTTEYLIFLYDQNISKYSFLDDDNDFINKLKADYLRMLTSALYDDKEFDRALGILDLLILDQPDNPELYMQYIENLYFGDKKHEAKIFADKHYERFHNYSRFKLVYDSLIAAS